MNQDFIWGVASAAYQIEGGVREGGRGLSIWDVFSHKKGKIRYGETGDVACDSYHRFEEDLDIIASLGVKNYRFSIAWPRIYPYGTGKLNQEGLDYYDKLVDGCLARGITPWITLFHWDLPQALQDEYGGWQGRQIVDDFTRYALTICRHFGDRVKNYFIMNEPHCFISLGYLQGIFAPGLELGPEGYFQCWHHALLAQGKAMKSIRAEFPDLKLGVASTGENFIPYGDTEEDERAAYEIMFGNQEQVWQYSHALYLDPICFGKYPDCTGTPIEEYVKQVSKKDMELISQKPDFIGLNIYSSAQVKLGDDGKPAVVPFYPGYPRNACKWAITPKVLKYVPEFVGERYGLPIIISENGLCNNDYISYDGKIHDLPRIEYLSDYIDALMDAKAHGAPVVGYFHWSILDNFEWASGYDERFGLIYVDYPTGKRIKKDSAYWYAERIMGQGTGSCPII